MIYSRFINFQVEAIWVVEGKYIYRLHRKPNMWVGERFKPSWQKQNSDLRSEQAKGNATLLLVRRCLLQSCLTLKVTSLWVSLHLTVWCAEWCLHFLRRPQGVRTVMVAQQCGRWNSWRLCHDQLKTAQGCGQYQSPRCMPHLLASRAREGQPDLININGGESWYNLITYLSVSFSTLARQVWHEELRTQHSYLIRFQILTFED